MTANPFRHAVYFAPEPGTPLDDLANRWLGRDAAGHAVPPVAVPGIGPAAWSRITAAPRRYGFHGTLKAPFRPAPGVATAAVTAAMAGLAARCRPFAMPPLVLAELGDFLALVPGAPCPALDRLARDCVTELDRFRAPPDAADLARRLAGGLTDAQRVLLARWGYPHVLDQFRFHLTLTGPLPDPTDRARIMRALQPLLEPVGAAPVPVRSLCRFEEAVPGGPLTLADRFAFGGN